MLLGIMAKLAKNHLQGSFNKRKEAWKGSGGSGETKYAAEGSRELNILLSTRGSSLTATRRGSLFGGDQTVYGQNAMGKFHMRIREKFE